MPRQDLQYISLVDFTPGIHARSGTPLSHRPGIVADGVPQAYAQEDGTWQCYGDPNGGLRPLPKCTSTLTQTITDVAGGTDGFPSSEKFVSILDISLMSPVMDSSITDYASTTLDAAFISWFWHRDPDGSTAYDRNAIGRQYKLFKSGTPTYDLWDISEEETGETDYLAYSTFFTSRGAYGILSIDDPNIDKIGLPQIRGMISCLEDNTTSDMHKMVAYPANAFLVGPDEDEVNETSFDITGRVLEFGFILGHQGRSVFGMRRSGADVNQYLEPFGADGRMPIAEALSWSGVNLVFTRREEAFWLDKTAFVEEAPSGYGAFASMNASELFLVKHKGGAVAVRGSLDNPTVIRLPGVEPTRSLMNVPVVTPFGCVYGSKSGVWLWAGGDTATCISPNLDGDFWITGPFTGEHRPGLKSRFTFSYPFVFVGNDWVLDVRSLESRGGPAWWKLVGRESGAGAAADTYPYMFYDVSWDGTIYAAPGAIDNTHTTVLDTYNPDTLATEYQWRSQPLMATLNRDIEFKDVILVAEGKGTVTITLSGLAGTTQSETFTFDSQQRPIRFQKPTTSRATDPIVTIKSVGDGTSAPIVHGVYLGYQTTAGIPVP